MLVVYVAYNKRSCKTGKEIYNYLKTKEKQWEVRRIFDPLKSPAKIADAVIRWGNSIHKFRGSVGCLEINANSSLASNKAEMMRIFKENKVRSPKTLFLSDNPSEEEMSSILDKNGKAFCRNRFDQVRYRKPIETDLYFTRNLDKQREFRVHVFQDRVIGVYEKVTLEGHVDKYSAILKNENSSFKRLDMADETVRLSVKGVRPVAKKAVKALGLDFGGVDVILSSNGKAYVNEVNSAPSLNSKNVPIYGDKFIEMIKSKS